MTQERLKELLEQIKAIQMELNEMEEQLPDEDSEQLMLELEEETAKRRKKTRGTKRHISPTEILIYCAIANATDTDFPNREHKPKQSEVMELFNRVGSTESLKRWSERSIGYTIVEDAIQEIKHYIDDGAWKEEE